MSVIGHASCSLGAAFLDTRTSCRISVGVLPRYHTCTRTYFPLDALGHFYRWHLFTFIILSPYRTRTIFSALSLMFSSLAHSSLFSECCRHYMHHHYCSVTSCSCAIDTIVLLPLTTLRPQKKSKWSNQTKMDSSGSKSFISLYLGDTLMHCLSETHQITC